MVTASWVCLRSQCPIEQREVTGVAGPVGSIRGTEARQMGHDHREVARQVIVEGQPAGAAEAVVQHDQHRSVTFALRMDRQARDGRLEQRWEWATVQASSCHRLGKVGCTDRRGKGIVQRLDEIERASSTMRASA